MRITVLAASLAGAASAEFPCVGDVEVEALVFSGTPNPSFSLKEGQREAFCNAVSRAAARVPTCRVLGFSGWRACSNGSCETFRGARELDALLLDALADAAPELPAPVFEHIKAEARRLDEDGGDEACPEEAPVVPVPNYDCTATPIVGPDDPKQVHFDVANDDGGCFVTEQSKNNCYAYANDIVTNSFPQPGRAAGLCPASQHPCVPNTCEDVKKAAVADGLTFVGMDLPQSLPERGHYVSLHIWPKSNFHWIRMDADMTWSHKPGGTAVRNHDNNGDVITDPGKADFSPWTEHCGYMLTVPSNATIEALPPQPLAV